MVDLPSVGESHVTGLGTSDNTGLGDQRVGQGRLSVVDVSDDRHVSDRRVEIRSQSRSGSVRCCVTTVTSA